MVHASPFIFDLALIMLVAAFAILFCKVLKQPLVLGYLLAGFFVSPHFPFLPTVTEVSSIEIWAEFGVIFLLFTLGFNFTFKKLIKVGSTAIIITLLKNLTLFSIGPLISFFLKLPSSAGILMGAIISITSTIVVAKSLEDEFLTESPFSSIIMGILIIEDLLVLLFILLISAIATSNSITKTNLFTSVGTKLLFISAVILIAFFLPKLISRFGHYLKKEMALILSLAFCLSIAMLSAKVGLSPALGAFIAGILLSETTESKKIIKQIRPIRDLFVAIFFISVGMMIIPSVLIKNWSLILLFSFFIIFVKGICTILAALLAKESLTTATTIGILTIPIGEFSFVIATLGISLGLIDQEFYSIIVTLSAISILATNYLLKLRNKITDKLLSLKKILSSYIQTLLK